MDNQNIIDTKEVEHQNRAHAKLSASSSHRWLLCSGSINAEESYKDETSVFAEEGTLAHELADLCLSSNKDVEAFPVVNEKEIEKDMQMYVQEYLDYVRSYENKKTTLETEIRVDFSHLVPEGFGTLDATVIDYKSGICHVFDLKYGQGVEVSPIENTQAQLYALGLLNEIDFLGTIHTFRLHIVQPRKGNVGYWETSLEDLNKFGEYVSERAKKALDSNAVRTAGPIQCKWCKAKANCKTLHDHVYQSVSNDFEDLDAITSLEDKRKLLDNKKLITDYMQAVENWVFDYIKQGNKFEGYKIVEGRSIRKWSNEAESVLTEKLKDDAYNKKLITLTEAKKHLDKKEIDALTVKNPGKLTLVPESDKRRPYDPFEE